MNAREAFLAAVAAHAGETDKGGEPSIFHPIAVADVVRGLGEDYEVVALLHDVWEDTDYDLEGLTLRQEQALRAITRNEGEGYFDYIRRVKKCFVARVVKIADLHHNLSPERAGFDPKLAESLEKRYRKALAILEASG